MLLIFLVVILGFPIDGKTVDPKTMIIGIVLENNKSGLILGNLPNIEQILPAIDIAFNKCKLKFKRFRNYTLIKLTTLLSTNMSSLLWEVVDMLQNKTRPHVILGPLSDFNIANIVRLSDGRYSVPLLTPSGSAMGLRKKQDFRMLTSILFTFADLRDVIMGLFANYNWKARQYKNVGIYTLNFQNDNNVGEFMSEIVEKTLISNGFRIAKETFKEKIAGNPNHDHKGSLEELSKTSRSKFVDSARAYYIEM